MKTVEWVIKASKFCNLRCAYCYEWNSLDDPERISIDDWSRLLSSIRDYHEHLQQWLGTKVETRVIWHGGEPLTLPINYLNEVMSLQHEMLNGLTYRILLQTNLFRLPPAIPDLLRQYDIGLGVSMDVIGNVRVDKRNQQTEAAVVANLDRLERLGISYGAITVVAKHNHHRLRDVHDFWARRRVDFRVLPLFEGPNERPLSVFEVSDVELVAALNDLFDYWIGLGAVVDVLPLSEWLSNVLREFLGLRSAVYDRRQRGESVLLVETNGDLYQTDERGRPELRLGNVVRDAIKHLISSPTYEASLLRTEKKTARLCHGCRHYGFCNGYPVHADPLEPSKRCTVTAAVHDHIAQSLLESGYDVETLHSILTATTTDSLPGTERRSVKAALN
jgi:uncharacterized protein